MSFDTLDLDALRRVPRISHYFRYPLHRSDFRELLVHERLRGHYASKPLHGGLTPERRVDRSSPYSGEVAALFVPVDIRSIDDAHLVLAHVDPPCITLASGRRNWPAIRAAARRAICAELGLDPASG